MKILMITAINNRGRKVKLEAEHIREREEWYFIRILKEKKTLTFNIKNGKIFTYEKVGGYGIKRFTEAQITARHLNA